MSEFTIKQNDTSPSLLYAIQPTSIDLTGATVVFNMRNQVTNVVQVSRKAAIVVTATGTPTVQYDWDEADTQTSGQFEAEFEVTHSNGRVETFPQRGFIGITITDDIA